MIHSAPAASIDELKDALRLVRREFAKERYLDLNPAFPPRIPKYNLVGTSRTFVAKYNDIVIGTVTVVPDSPEGLPMDEIYKEELDQVRSLNKSVAQFTQLAVNRDFLREERRLGGNVKESQVFIQLFHLAFHLSIYKGIDCVAIMINPKHRSFYEEILPFEKLGGLKYPPSLKQAPAYAYVMYIEKAYQNADKNKLCRRFITQPPDYGIFDQAPIWIETAA